MDIDECEQHPCENDGECFQRSILQNYGTLPELTTANFSYNVAAGFICRCLPGFAGKLQIIYKNIHFSLFTVSVSDQSVPLNRR